MSPKLNSARKFSSIPNPVSRPLPSLGRTWPISEIILNANGTSTVRNPRTRALRKAGYHVIETAHGAGTLQAALEKEPDLILMNELSGTADLKICAQLRDNPTTREIPLISICSSHVRNHTSYADSCFLEPVNSRTLLSVIRLMLRLKSAERWLGMRTAAPVQNPFEDQPKSDTTQVNCRDQSIAHDFLSPLSTITSMISWICAEYGDQLGVSGREYLGLLEQSVDRMRAVILRAFATSVPGGETRPPGPGGSRPRGILEPRDAYTDLIFDGVTASPKRHV